MSGSTDDRSTADDKANFLEETTRMRVGPFAKAYDSSVLP